MDDPERFRVDARGDHEFSTYLGRANISVTLDLCGHLMPGADAEAAGLLQAYLTAQRERADATARARGRADDPPENAPTGTSAGASVA